MKHLIKRWETGAETPAIDNAPEVDIHLKWVWGAYAQLDKSRQWGMSTAQPIQLSEIESYARMHRIDDDEELEQLITTVQYLDSAYLKRLAQRNK